MAGGKKKPCSQKIEKSRQRQNTKGMREGPRTAEKKGRGTLQTHSSNPAATQNPGKKRVENRQATLTRNQRENNKKKEKIPDPRAEGVSKKEKNATEAARVCEKSRRGSGRKEKMQGQKPSGDGRTSIQLRNRSAKRGEDVLGEATKRRFQAHRGELMLAKEKGYQDP